MGLERGPGTRFPLGSRRWELPILSIMSATSGPEASPKWSAKSIYEQRKRYSTEVMADVSQYPVNHLVTFCLDEEDGVHTVEDASRKLALMDSQGRIWTQEMLLRVSPKHVALLDPDSKEELESYPLSAIVRCDTVMLPGQSCSLMLLVCQDSERTQPDVHFFQGLRLGVELIREDIQGALHSYRSGRGERRAAALWATRKELQLHSLPAAETPPLQHRPTVRAAVSWVEPAAGCGRPQVDPIPEAEEVRRPARAEASSSPDLASRDLGPHGPDLASLQAERDVDILNHVFDDVESFVSRLQKSAEAARVLEHRERSRRTRRREAGEGLLTLRAKPPSEAEYTDVLQKIKYAFSLLARLRGNIANPSSQELLHFLFGPLQMIVDASGGPQFASGVRHPHLTSEAVALLRDNVTQRENTLWTSLGDSWTRPGLELPREEGPPYRPEFCSGWEPPATDPEGGTWDDPVEKQLQHERRRQQQSAPQVAVNGHGDQEPEAEPQLEGEPARKWVLCNYDFQARNSSELAVKRWDLLEVLNDERKWWKVRDQRGQEGYVPYNILTPHPGPPGGHSQSPDCSLENSTPPPAPGSARALAPAPPPPPALAPAPCPQPAPALASAPARSPRDSSESLNNMDSRKQEKFSQMLCINEELQARLAKGLTGLSRAAVGPRAPEPQLSPRSNASEVRAWLQAKGFSSGTVAALGALSGAQLFSLQKEKFRELSPEEGARVFSQVSVQRALLEDKEKVSELEAVMKKQKRRMEDEVKTEVL
ncbi:Epidermal growth factor receptor kinase substrate 8-like protein 1 [Camelus dromedarius]|uniref:Epidermal growth factor receptor kinase substrate 8-like protein 1 n=1 Tax=Camelus dromedarius TaxID=9838 RepID=A0A5N4DRC1_CAMDR|nr:Epidermal growth factor receptor kinase substrate 8-like protein 1 [Camelus dromedarius]KAB1273662.1 Epidermal growth factor receptor kinase substrate 8-like protein 1 [Camelus dromedarius]